MKNKNLILIGIVLIIVIVGAVSFFKGPSITNLAKTQAVSEEEPMDIVLDFYDPWLEAARSTETNPYEAGLVDNPILSKELRETLVAAEGGEGKDPVVCQDPVPEKIVSKSIFVSKEEIRILVFSREQKLAGQAIVTLRSLNDGWYISDILCSRGEFGEEREFTFEYKGHLLKNIPTAQDFDAWHLVYTQDGVPGYAAQLFFDAESVCVDLEGSESVCDPMQLSQGAKAKLQGNMSEQGVTVKRIILLDPDA